MIVWDILLGFFIGTMCGVVPLVFGILTKHKIVAVVGIVASAASGVIFALIDRTPFTAIGVAFVFVIFIFAKNKRGSFESDRDDQDIYFDDE